jgi:uncharacterized RDD family membrane protein YckC
MDDAEPCSFCDYPAEDGPDSPRPASAGYSMIDESPEPEWRREVGRRLAEYRARSGYLSAAVPPEPAAKKQQVELPFRESSSSKRTIRPEIPEPQRERPTPPRPRTLARLRPPERLEIRIQPELDFSSAEGQRAHPQNAMVPVATISERRNALLLDAIFILLACAAFAALFIGLIRAMGGEIVVDRMDAFVCAPILYLFYSLYFLVFTVFAGATPGMQFCRLTVVRLDGHLPDTGQLVWRSFGYLLSGATLMLGFFWASWDEDGFTWQDRISQTYVTSSAPLANPDPLEIQWTDRKAARR